MNVLLLGVGKQRNAVLYDVIHSPNVSELGAADKDFAALQAYVRSQP